MKGDIDMAKPNKRHHDLCVAYKNRGQRELNKQEKVIKEQKKIEKIKARTARKLAENPKEYVPKDPEARGTNKQEPLGDFAYRPKMKHMTEYAKQKSFERRIKNQLDKELMEEKKAERSKKKNS